MSGLLRFLDPLTRGFFYVSSTNPLPVSAGTVTSPSVNTGSPAAGMADITPSASALVGVRSLVVTVAGNLEITGSDGVAVTAFPVVVGQIIPCAIQKVTSGTTATVKALKGYA